MQRALNAGIDTLYLNAYYADPQTYMRFHDLRHSAATIMLSKGTHPKVAQEILGHSQIRVTLDVYSHVLPSIQEDITKRWDDDFGAGVPSPVK